MPKIKHLVKGEKHLNPAIGFFAASESPKHIHILWEVLFYYYLELSYVCDILLNNFLSFVLLKFSPNLCKELHFLKACTNRYSQRLSGRAGLVLSRPEQLGIITWLSGCLVFHVGKTNEPLKSYKVKYRQNTSGSL